MKTPACICGSTTSWVIRRELYERKTWNPETQQLQDKDIECPELDVYCSECNHYCGDQQFIDRISLL